MAEPIAMTGRVAVDPVPGVVIASLLPLEVRALVHASGDDTLLADIDLRLEASVGCTVILGPNGAGKSLLLKLLHGLLVPASGSIRWNGEPTSQGVRRRQSLVFQKPVLLRRSVIENVAFVLRTRGDDPRSAAGWLERVGLEHKATQAARRLSGGEQQRLALARALATRPEILLLDEPTASLDPASVLAIESIVRDALAAGVRVLFVTHDLGQARRLADEVLFLHRGRLLEHAAADRFFSAPTSGPARDFLAGRIVV